MTPKEVWLRMQRVCVHMDLDCTDSGNKTRKCTFKDCPFMAKSYDWEKFVKEGQT